MSSGNLQRLLRELSAAADALAAEVTREDARQRFLAALMDARDAWLPADMPEHNALIARGAEYLNDGVYTEDESIHIRLTGNAYSRENVIFLEGNTYVALRHWAQSHGYEPKPPERTR